jgi:hypothetical protein
MGAILFLLGSLAGVLATWISEELWPGPEDPMVAPLREVREFVRESFVREVGDEERSISPCMDGRRTRTPLLRPRRSAGILERDGRPPQGVGTPFRPSRKESCLTP